MTDREKFKTFLEAVLFSHGGPLTLNKLAKVFSLPENEVEEILEDLGRGLEENQRGTRLLRSGEEFLLGSAPEASHFVEKLFREEFGEELTPASLETLAIIAYRGPIARAEIDYIRGVNSSYILRSLLIRGLVSRSQDVSRPQIFLYRPSFDLLKLLGATSQKDLPDYEDLSKKLGELNKTESDSPNLVLDG